MRLHPFNRERALRKLRWRQHRGQYIKIGTIILSVCILVIGIIYYSYSKYTVTKNFDVIQTTVGDFRYKDGTGASVPELYQGMIPVTYDASGNVIVADTSLEWYNYSSHNWANAVLVNCADTTIKDKYFSSDMSIKPSSVGTTIPMSDILEMYVWIPRYKYLLWNAANGSSDPQAITIVFEDKTTTKSSGSTVSAARDATKETLKTFGSYTGGWNGDYAYFPNSTISWFMRGGLLQLWLECRCVSLQ